MCWELNAELGSEADGFSMVARLETELNPANFGAFKVLLAVNKRKKKFSPSARVGTIVPKSVLGQ